MVVTESAAASSCHPERPRLFGYRLAHHAPSQFQCAIELHAGPPFPRTDMTGPAHAPPWTHCPCCPPLGKSLAFFGRGTRYHVLF